MGGNVRAIADFSKAIELNPEYVNAYLGRARALSNIGDRVHALADLWTAIDLNPQIADAPYEFDSKLDFPGEHDIWTVGMQVVMWEREKDKKLKISNLRFRLGRF